jgi:AcrR family transcriptional regulator
MVGCEKKMNERKSQIVEEARRLFGRYGFDKVTIKQLAEACGITEPALYRHFRSKDDIYDAVLDSLKTIVDYQSLFDRLEDETEIKTILFEIATHILGFFQHHREMYRLVLFSALREHARARKTFREIRGPYVKFLAGQLDRLYSLGKIKKKNNEITARCFVGMVFDCSLGSTLWKGFQGKNFKPEDIIANNVPVFVDGLLV